MPSGKWRPFYLNLNALICLTVLHKNVRDYFQDT